MRYNQLPYTGEIPGAEAATGGVALGPMDAAQCSAASSGVRTAHSGGGLGVICRHAPNVPAVSATEGHAARQTRWGVRCARLPSAA